MIEARIFGSAMQQNVDQVISGNLSANSYQVLIDQVIRNYFEEELLKRLKPQSTIDKIINSNFQYRKTIA